MEVLEKLKGCDLGLYDNRSKDNKSVVAEKVIDVTSLCPKSKQVVIKYANVTRGQIAQICDWYDRGKDLGLTVHYHINEMTPVQLANDIVFERQAISMGAHPVELANAIYDNKPNNK